MDMGIPGRHVFLRFQIDTNRINARQCLPNMNLLEAWATDGVIELGMSWIAQQESSYNEQSARKASQHIFSETRAGTKQEQLTIQRIRHILFPNGTQNPGEEKDVEIVFNAQKYGYILITNDGDSKRQSRGILGSKQDLETELNIQVMSDLEAVHTVREAIEKRDQRARQQAIRLGVELPEWVGHDT